MKCFSLFSGIGGFDLAAQKLGHEIVGACEIDKYARLVYAKHFPDVPIYKDATKINPDNIPDFDILVAGFPCQAFSIAGRRKGFEDTRGTLFFEIARIAKQKRPQYMLLENVKGLLSHEGGKTVRKIYQTLDELGYDTESSIINTKNFLPQNRERIFIIATLRGQGRRQIFPIRKSDKKSNQRKTEKQITNSLQCPGHSCGNYRGMTMIVLHQSIQQQERVRRLTPTEYSRLQGFEDDYTKGLSDTQQYHCLGNAVSVPVVEHILSRLTLQTKSPGDKS